MSRSSILEENDAEPLRSGRYGRIRAKRKISVPGICVILVIASLLIAYPLIDVYLDDTDSDAAIEDVQKAWNDAGDVALQESLNDAYKYNDKLIRSAATLDDPGDNLLISGGDGVIGIISAPRIGLRAPIYASSADDMSVHGARRTNGTSLPVGGSSTNAVIEESMQNPSSRAFSLIRNLESGDWIVVTVDSRDITYRVESSETVASDALDSLEAQQGEDLLSLVASEQYDGETKFIVHAVRTEGVSVSDDMYDSNEDIITSLENLIERETVKMSMYQVGILGVGITILLIGIWKIVSVLRDKDPREIGRLKADAG